MIQFQNKAREMEPEECIEINLNHLICAASNKNIHINEIKKYF